MLQSIFGLHYDLSFQDFFAEHILVDVQPRETTIVFLREGLQFVLSKFLSLLEASNPRVAYCWDKLLTRLIEIDGRNVNTMLSDIS